MARVADAIRDGGMLALIDGFSRQEMARWTPMAGTPKRAVISLLLANLYLHPLDLVLEANGPRVTAGIVAAVDVRPDRRESEGRCPTPHRMIVGAIAADALVVNAAFANRRWRLRWSL
jgi:hypothetical protein